MRRRPEPKPAVRGSFIIDARVLTAVILINMRPQEASSPLHPPARTS
jgi:hypothetical protein